jgi:L-lysine 2,3-aminomutase
MNQHPKVYDIIISGGEPLTISNSELKWMLAEFKKAKFLKVLRICTGTLFLGLPFRFDDGLLDALTEFSASTGVRVTFNTHLSTYYQMTPEAVFATWRARDRGFSIYSQVPIREGLNFFSDNVDRTIEVWRRLGELQLLCNVEPYKFIIDMHPRTLAYYVPIECAIKVWGMVCESHEQPELQRPRTLSIFSRQGNIILSGHTLFAMRKDVNRKRKTVTYWIPKTHSPGVYRPGRKMQYFRYDEPLMESRNDNPTSLEELAARWFTSG